MKKNYIIIFALMFLQGIANASTADVMMGASTAAGVATNIILTKNNIDNSNKATDSFVRNINAQTENIQKNGGLQIIHQPDGTAKVYQNGVEFKSKTDPSSAEYKMGLKITDGFVSYIERKNAQAKLKEIKALAKIEKDTETLNIIKKYKKTGAVITLQKIEESK